MSTTEDLRRELVSSYQNHAAVASATDRDAASTPYDIGRRALNSGVGLIELVATHAEATREAVAPDSDALLELLAPFEMVIRGYRETIARLSEMNRELFEKNADLAMFSHAMAHDLRNPLATITMWASFARVEFEDDPRKTLEVIDIIERAARHATDLVADLLEYAQLDRTQAPMEPVNVNDLLEGVMASLTSTIKNTGAVIDPGRLPTLSGRGAQIEHLLQNLIENAIKYRGNDHPRIRFDASRRQTTWILRCHDNGRGIAADQRDEVFQPFSRGAEVRDVPGSGLGLAICRRIVEGHGGQIWIDDSGPRGTTFAFSLPAAS